MKIVLGILGVLFSLIFMMLCIYKNRRINSILDKVNIIRWSWDIPSQKLNLPQNIKKLYDISPKNFNNRISSWREIIFSEDILKIRALYQDIITGKINRVEFRLNCSKNSPVWVEARIIRFRNWRGKIHSLEGVLIDITERKKIEKQMKNMAYQDCLTQLPNRSKLSEYFKNALARAKSRETNIVLFFIDLDNFKDINDKYGHIIGDSLLQAVGKKLQNSIRKEDFLARLGGDEFILVLEDVCQKDVEIVIERIEKCFSNSFIIQGINIKVSLSLGISSYPQNGHDIKTLLDKADQAMYKHKKKLIEKPHLNL